MSYSSQALRTSLPARRRQLLQRPLSVAFAAVWIVLPLLPLSAVLLSWLSGL